MIKRGKPTSNTTTTGAGTSPVKGAAAPPTKAAPQKFVTLVAQPDLYGGVLVLFKSVTDSAHLDEMPQMRLVAAVDVMADNRGELLFELRGKTQRQFALFRVMARVGKSSCLRRWRCRKGQKKRIYSESWSCLSFDGLVEPSELKNWANKRQIKGRGWGCMMFLDRTVF